MKIKIDKKIILTLICFFTVDNILQSSISLAETTTFDIKNYDKNLAPKLPSSQATEAIDNISKEDMVVVEDKQNSSKNIKNDVENKQNIKEKPSSDSQNLNDAESFNSNSQFIENNKKEEKALSSKAGDIGQESDWEYEWNYDKTILTLVKYKGSSLDMKIPRYLQTSQGTASVSVDGYRVFQTNGGARAIRTIDCSAIYINNAENMFQNYSQLTDVNFSSSQFNNNGAPLNLSNMFVGCNALKKVNLGTFYSVSSTAGMFQSCSNLSEVRIGSLGREVTNTSDMFSNCSNLSDISIGTFNTSNITDMTRMFSRCYNLSNINMGGDIGYWDTSKVTSMTNMFYECGSLRVLNIGNWKTSNVTNMKGMFTGCNLSKLNIESWDTSKVTNMHGMFYECSNLSSLNLDNWNTSKVTNMEGMFYRCSNLSSLNLDNWNTSNVTNMQGMFRECSKLSSIDIDSWNTSNVIAMDRMFSECDKLLMLNLSNWNLNNNVSITNMFYAVNPKEMMIIYRNPSFFQAYPFIQKNIYPLTAVTLQAGDGMFEDKSKEKNFKYKSPCISSEIPTLDNVDFGKEIPIPRKTGYIFSNWNKSTNLYPQIWTAQYIKRPEAIPPTESGNNTSVKNPLAGDIGFVYRPDYFSGNGDFEHRISEYGKTGTLKDNFGMFNLNPKGDKKEKLHVGVADYLNTTNSWSLKASFSTTMPYTSLVLRDTMIGENIQGKVNSSNRVTLGKSKPITDLFSSSCPYSGSYIEVGTTPQTLFSANTNYKRDGVYDFSAKATLLSTNYSQVAAGKYSGKINWELCIAP